MYNYVVVTSYNLRCTFFFSLYGDHRDLHVLTHSFPTRRSSDLNTADQWRRTQQTGLNQTVVCSSNANHVFNHVTGVREKFQRPTRSEEHTSELQSLMRISYAVFCLKKKQKQKTYTRTTKAKETTLQYKQ